ncbi:MAG: OsmC family protein [Myxococcota bacterium]
MAVEMSLSYTGDLHCELVHGPSKTRIETDAPLDNAGRGAAFSPTDLVGAALLSCAVTTMAIRGPKEGVPFSGATGTVKKSMSTDAPRRIVELAVEIRMPAGLSPKDRQVLEDIARGCPVARSLGAGVAHPMIFHYPD